MKSVNIILLVFISFACSKQVAMSSSNQLNGDWTVAYTTLNEEMVSIAFTNVSESQLSLLSPMEKKLQMLVDDEWVKVGIFYCDCGLSCPAPPNERTFEPGEVWNFTWDLMVEECVEKDGSTTTVKTKAKPGNYRVSYDYQLPNSRERKKVIATFKIES